MVWFWHFWNINQCKSTDFVKLFLWYYDFFHFHTLWLCDCHYQKHVYCLNIFTVYVLMCSLYGLCIVYVANDYNDYKKWINTTKNNLLQIFVCQALVQSCKVKTKRTWANTFFTWATHHQPLTLSMKECSGKKVLSTSRCQLSKGN